MSRTINEIIRMLNFSEIYKALIALRNMARSLNGFVFITVNENFFENRSINDINDSLNISVQAVPIDMDRISEKLYVVSSCHP